jgi:hypothetical protein
MSHCSPLGEAATAAVEMENMEETMISTELEHAFGENPAASDGERYVASPNAKDDMDEGASDNVKLRTCYFGHRPSRSVKLRRWKRNVTSQRAKLAHLGMKPCKSQMATKPSCMRTFYRWLTHASASGPG